MKRKGIFVVIIIALCLIVFCVLFLTGVIKINLNSNKSPSKKHAMAYVKYMNSYMLVSEDGYVVASEKEAPNDLPEISGISYKSIVVGEKIEPNEQKEYKYAIKLIDNFKKNSMLTDTVYISSDKTATVTIKKVKILFGKDNDTEEKIRDLRDFYNELANLDGTLDMTELSENNAGYTFKKN